MTKRKYLQPRQPDAEVQPIPGYEGLYSVTRDGRIWSHAKPGNHFGQWIKVQQHRDGYLKVVLFKEKAGRAMFVHRAVALAWVANPEQLPSINHKNGVKTDNRSANLEWCTVADNNKHAFATGLNPGRRCLTEAVAAQIKGTSGLSHAALAQRYGVSDTTIGRVLSGTWGR